MAQTRNMLNLLENNLDKLRAMLRHGTVMQSDVDMMEAQCLSVKQQLIQAERSSKNYREVLGMFIGKQLAGQELLKPDASIPHDLVPNRPELRYFEAQAQVNEAKKPALRLARCRE